ncbi:MAG: PilX N-terminal domain-containing pilus assembly protein [Candidatus Zixiibacteriota bacterium]
MKRHVLRTENGIAALVALIMIGMLTLIGLAALTTSDDEVAISGNQLQETRAFYAAEAGLEKAAAALQVEFETTGAPPTTLPVGTEEVNNCSVSYSAVDDGPAVVDVLTTGTLAGLHALIKSFTITSTGENPTDAARVVMSQSFETALIPLFQFAVFYGNDLEIAPGPAMSLIGRVHSNGNMWLQSGVSLRMDSYVTASGDILHGRKGPGGVSTGDVLIKNAAGTYVSMKDGSEWLDANDTNWYDASVSRWNGRVQDQAHGMTELNVPLTGSSDPHKLIEPATSNPDSYENKATLKIINGVAYQKIAGLWTDVTAGMQAAGIISYSADKFTDKRENKKVDATELDIQALYNNPAFVPSNGVIYFSDDIASASEWPALRIKNGSELGDALTIASANPVYTLGNFNSVNKKPASIMADALTYLSGAWNDARSADVNYTTRIATATTVNCSYLTGNVETDATYYSGGFENLPRFLEDWKGKNFTWSGSAINLWASVQAIGPWGATAYYRPPNRVWSYDTDLDDPNKLPPETPVVRVFQRSGWKQDYVSLAAGN